MSDMQEPLGLGEERPEDGRGWLDRAGPGDLPGPARHDGAARPPRAAPQAPRLRQGGIHRPARPARGAEARGAPRGPDLPRADPLLQRTQWDDRKGDIHGMAIKLVGVAGEKLLEAEKAEQTQDFVPADHPVFFIRDLADYVPFSEALLEARRSRWSRLGFMLRVLVSLAPALEGAPGGHGQEARQPAPDPVLEPDPLPPGPTGGPVLQPAGPDARAAPAPLAFEGQAPRGPVRPPRRPGRPASTSWSRSRPTRSRCPSRTRPSAGTRRRPRIARSPRSGSRRRSSTPRSRWPSARTSPSPPGTPSRSIDPSARSTGLAR